MCHEMMSDISDIMMSVDNEEWRHVNAMAEARTGCAENFTIFSSQNIP